jgi:hypothetical protein
MEKLGHAADNKNLTQERFVPIDLMQRSLDTINLLNSSEKSSKDEYKDKVITLEPAREERTPS